MGTGTGRRIQSPAKIIDAKTYRDEQNSGNPYPFFLISLSFVPCIMPAGKPKK